jgi:hypothetical protein
MSSLIVIDPFPRACALIAPPHRLSVPGEIDHGGHGLVHLPLADGRVMAVHALGEMAIESHRDQVADASRSSSTGRRSHDELSWIVVAPDASDLPSHDIDDIDDVKKNGPFAL